MSIGVFVKILLMIFCPISWIAFLCLFNRTYWK